jgi:hypothetical protein
MKNSLFIPQGYRKANCCESVKRILFKMNNRENSGQELCRRCEKTLALPTKICFNTKKEQMRRPTQARAHQKELSWGSASFVELYDLLLSRTKIRRLVPQCSVATTIMSGYKKAALFSAAT